jgi:hypothetical protein
MNTVSQPELGSLVERLKPSYPSSRNRIAFSPCQFQAEEDSLLRYCLNPLQTPEAVELRSIGFAVAAFGGGMAIADISYALNDRGCPHVQFLWMQWEGMADFVL